MRYGLRRCKIAIEVPSKIAILAGADSPLKFLYVPSSFLEGFPPSSAFERRKRVRSVLGGMMKMMLLGWEQNNQE
ncbi:MAG: hypothetical protein EGQ98_04165 [Clostridium sp.]|nr:hypothetical protein [Clostridium sp.]